MFTFADILTYIHLHVHTYTYIIIFPAPPPPPAPTPQGRSFYRPITILLLLQQLPPPLPTPQEGGLIFTDSKPWGDVPGNAGLYL